MKGSGYFLLMCALSSIVLTMSLGLVHAEPDFQIKKVVFSKDVTDRNPKGIFSPSAYCEKDKNGHAAIPIVKTSQASKVVFWTKVTAAINGTLRHSWHHQIDGIWRMVSEVNLSIRPSSGYRMWSLKSLKPEIHTGEWMVVVAPSNEPEKILCITRFTVQ